MRDGAHRARKSERVEGLHAPGAGAGQADLALEQGNAVEAFARGGEAAAESGRCPSSSARLVIAPREPVSALAQGMAWPPAPRCRPRRRRCGSSSGRRRARYRPALARSRRAAGDDRAVDLGLLQAEAARAAAGKRQAQRPAIAAFSAGRSDNARIACCQSLRDARQSAISRQQRHNSRENYESTQS